MEKINYQKQLEKLLEQLKTNGEKPTLLLHSCCAPCSSYVIEYLVEFFKITVYYYNPNIFPKEEHEKRKAEQKRLIGIMNESGKQITFTDDGYDEQTFKLISKGLENDSEGGNRCTKCYELRLDKTARKAAIQKFDYFCTTLSVSPYKNAKKINDIGKILEKKYNAKYLISDFKKREGYKRSIELSKQYELYRQEYCGCESSLKQARKMQKKEDDIAK